MLLSKTYIIRLFLCHVPYSKERLFIMRLRFSTKGAQDGNTAGSSSMTARNFWSCINVTRPIARGSLADGFCFWIKSINIFRISTKASLYGRSTSVIRHCFARISSSFSLQIGSVLSSLFFKAVALQLGTSELAVENMFHIISTAWSWCDNGATKSRV